MNAKLSRATKIIYGAGDLGFSLTSTIIGAYFLFFLTDVVLIKPAVAGIAILIGKTWDYINDPLTGHISDRTRSRRLRRHAGESGQTDPADGCSVAAGTDSGCNGPVEDEPRRR